MGATRFRKDKQIDKSTTPHSLVYTNSSNEQTYFLPPLVAGDFVLKWDGTSTDLSWLSTSSLINIYNNDGTITGPRVVSFNDPLTFQYNSGGLDASLVLDSNFTYSSNEPGVASGVINITPSLASMAVNDVSTDTGSGVSVQPNLTRLYAENNTSGDNVMFDITNQTGVIASTYAGFQGLKYFADYSANFTSLSLITKGYLDGIIATLPTDNIYTADGTLLDTRTLTGDGFNLSFQMGSGDYVSNTVLGPDISETFLQNTLTDDITTQSLSSSGLYQSWENTGSGGSSSYYLDSSGFRFIRLGGTGTQKIEANSAGMFVTDDELDQGLEYEFNHAAYFATNPRSIPDVGYVQSLISAMPSLWTDAGAYTYLTSTSDRLLLGSSTELNTSYRFQVSGSQITSGNVVANQQNSYMVTLGSASGFPQYPGIWFGSATPSLSNYSIVSDPSTGILSLNAQTGAYLLSSVAGTEVTRLTSTGLGIRTLSNPTQPLDVNGNVRFRSGLYDGSNSVGSSGNVLTSTGSATAWSSLSSLSIPTGTGVNNQWAYWSGTNTLTTSNIIKNNTNYVDMTLANGLIVPSRTTFANQPGGLYAVSGGSFGTSQHLFYLPRSNQYSPVLLGNEFQSMAYGSWTTSNPLNPEQYGIMYGLDGTRWTVSNTGSLAAGGNTYVRTYTLNSATLVNPAQIGLTYPRGKALFGFWYQRSPASISLRVRRGSDGVYFGPYTADMTRNLNNSNPNFGLYSIDIPPNFNYLDQIEITILTQAGTVTDWTWFDYIPYESIDMYSSRRSVDLSSPMIRIHGHLDWLDVSPATVPKSKITGDTGNYFNPPASNNGIFAIGTSSPLNNTALTLVNPVVDNQTYFSLAANTRAGVVGLRVDGYANTGVGTAPINVNTRFSVLGKGATSSTFTAQFHNSTGTNNILVIRDDSKIGVLTNAPTQALDINGAMRLRGGFYDFANSPGTAGDILTSFGAGTGPVWQSLFTLNVPTGAGTAGQIAYYTSTLGLNSETGSGANAFTWNSTNNRFGVRTSAPSATAEIRGDSLGVTQTTGDGLFLHNSTLATSGNQQISPSIRWRGSGWKTNATAGSQTVDFRAYVLPVQGAASPTGRLYFGSGINGTFTDGQFVFDSTGTFGIGITAPTSRLHIDNSTLTSAYILGTGALSGSTNIRSIDMTRTTGSGSFDYVQTHSGTGDNCIQLIGNTTGDTFIVFTISGPSVSYTQGVDTSDSNIFKFGVGGTTPSTISSTAFSYDGPNSRIGIGGSPHSGGQKIYLQGSMKIDLGSDATGDVYYRNSSGNFVRLPIGSSGQALKVSSGIPAWGTDLNGIYTGSGSLSGATTVTMGANQLLFSGSSGAGHTLTADLDPSTQIHLKMLDTSGVDPELTELILTETSVNLGIGNAAIFSTESSYINFTASGTTWNYGGHEILMDSSGIFITEGGAIGIQYITDYSAGILDNNTSIPDIFTVRQNAVENYEVISSTTSPVNLTNHIPDYLIAQGATQATFTFNLPATPANGRIVKLTFSTAVTALTIGAQGGITILGTAATTAAVGTQLEYKYYSSISAWIRVK